MTGFSKSEESKSITLVSFSDRGFPSTMRLHPIAATLNIRDINIDKYIKSE